MTTKTELLEQQKKMQKEMDAMQSTIDGMDDGEWPQDGDTYWFVSNVCGVSKDIVGRARYRHIKAQGNFFRSKKGAELKAKQNEVLQQMREIADSGKDVDWKNVDVKKYFIKYDHVDKVWETDFWWRGQNAGQIYFFNRELAQQAIDTLDLDCLLEIAR